MIAVLTAAHFRVAHAAVADFFGGQLDYPAHAYSSMLRVHHALVRSVGARPRQEAFVTISTGLLCSAAGYCIFGWPYDSRIGLQLLTQFLHINGHDFISSEREQFAIMNVVHSVPRVPLCPSDAVLTTVRHWVGASAFDRRLYQTPNEQLGVEAAPDPVRCFIGCPMSDPSQSELDVVAAISDEIASVMSGEGIACYQPMQHTDPRQVPDLAHSPAVRAIDEREIARSDLVVILCDRPATGVGVVAALAERYGAIVVVISDVERVSPMVTGACPSPRVIPLRGNLKRSTVSFLHEHGATLASRARRRAFRMGVLAEQLKGYRLRLELLQEDELVAEVAITIERDRFRQLLAWEGFLLGASHDEIDQLETVLGLRLPELPLDQQRALLAAEFEYGSPEIYVCSRAWPSCARSLRGA